MKNLKRIASTKVKAGVRLLIAEDIVGELYSIPLNPNIWAENLQLERVISTWISSIRSIKTTTLQVNKLNSDTATIPEKSKQKKSSDEV